jgi:hypothetical protein
MSDLLIVVFAVMKLHLILFAERSAGAPLTLRFSGGRAAPARPLHPVAWRMYLLLILRSAQLNKEPS